VQVGRVTDIKLAPGGEGVFVTMEVSQEVVIPPQAGVILAPASLFGDWQASLVSLASQPNLTFTRSADPDVLPGATLPDITELTAVGARIAEDLETLSERVELAFTEETALEIRSAIENVQEITEQLTGFVEQQTETYASVGQNVLAATQNIQQATQTVQRVAGQVEQEIPAIVANARLASENLQQLSQQLQTATTGVPELVAEADRTLANFGELAVSVNQLLATLEPAAAEVGPTLVEARQAVATLQAAAARIEQGEGTLGRLLEDPALYEETQAAIATLRRVLADLQANPGRYISEVQIF
jgi:phospholipid/cholesterol/gamma-HCH transport system substrate-binding protein